MPPSVPPQQPGPAGQSAQRWDVLLSTLAAGVIETDLAGRFVYANPAALRIFGITAEAFIGRTAGELGIERHDETGVLVPQERAPVLRAGRDGLGTVQTVLRYTRRPALDVWLESQTAPVFSPSGDLTGTVSSFIDVTDRFRLEASERAGHAQMNDVLKSMAAGVVLVDAEGRIEYANAAAAAISGLRPEDVIGQLVADPAWQLTDAAGNIVAYDALPVPTALRERREVRGVELGVPTMAGVRWMRVSAHPVFHSDGTLRGAVVTTEDITERRALNEQLLHAQKIEGIGQLAGGIAHDFNNLLTIILGHAELTLLAASADPATEESIAEIRDAARRGSALTRQLLMFARKQVAQPRAVHFDRLAASLEPLLRRALGEQITLRTSSDAELWPVQVDPGQMEQVIVNMAINARDAMPSGGTLSIEARNRVIEARDAEANPGIEPGEYVTLSVGDTGTGMSRETMAHIFEPFFTTKPVGSGSGLGLSICHGVVKQSRGFIAVDSEPGRGTTFRISLPRAAESGNDTVAPLDTPLARGIGTILLVEDEDAVRSLVARALGGYGYEVISAGSGRQALALYDRMSAPPDLLLTDVVMPDMGGLELARALRVRAPELPILFMTGYFDVRSSDALALNVEENLLLKPFTPMQLALRVQRLLAT